MTQLVFIHGPGAGGSSLAWEHQLARFPGSLAPDFPGVREGESCSSVAEAASWLRGWLWAQGKHRDLVLCGYTLGSSIALQYGLDHPDEVKGLILTTVELKAKPRTVPSHLDRCLKAASGDPAAYAEWMAFHLHAMRQVPAPMRERLLAEHRKVGPKAQHDSLCSLFSFDATERISTLKPRLLLIRGDSDPFEPPQNELEIHRRVPGSRLVRVEKGGHFPATECPDEVNPLIEEFVASLA